MSSSPPESVTSALTSLRRHKAAGEIEPGEAEHLATLAAQAFLAHYRERGESLRDAVRLLCEVATLPNGEAARAGTAALFPSIIEPLADAFEPAACRVYASLFAQVIDFCRTLPEGKPLDLALRKFGLDGEQDLLERVARIARIRPFASREDDIRKILVLSRVTLGADVAVTSVILDKVKRRFPGAEIVFLATDGARELFGGDPRITVHPLNYLRGGTLLGRLLSWLDLVERVARETHRLRPDESLVIDPDSRLTQLGLLPLVQDDALYYFFESRSFQSPGVESLGQLTGRWLTRVFGADEEIFPFVAPPSIDGTWARELTAPLRKAGRFLVSVNLGVGENPRKRLRDPFEEDLLAMLVAEGATILLDHGAGQEETARVSVLLGRLAALGHRIADLTAGPEPGAVDAAKVIAWQGGIGRLAALIAESHLYIGYDSAGQHIAAARDVPTIDIFTGFTSPMMPKRWRPFGPARVSLVTVADERRFDPKQTLREVLRLYREHRAASSR